MSREKFGGEKQWRREKSGGKRDNRGEIKFEGKRNNEEAEELRGEGEKWVKLWETSD